MYKTIFLCNLLCTLYMGAAAQYPAQVGDITFDSTLGDRASFYVYRPEYIPYYYMAGTKYGGGGIHMRDPYVTFPDAVSLEEMQVLWGGVIKTARKPLPDKPFR